MTDPSPAAANAPKKLFQGIRASLPAFAEGQRLQMSSVGALPQHELLIDLLNIPAQRLDLAATDVLASVQDARQILDHSGKQALFVTGGHGAGRNRIYGVVTREEIDRAYRSS